MSQAIGYAAKSATSPLTPFHFERRVLGPQDVQIDILFCGVCHSDLHTARNEWHGTVYPVVPGHEIVGKVTKVGKQVTQFKVGDLAAVGCMVDSCQNCNNCADGLEQYCEQGAIFTYNSEEKQTGGMTYGGYADHIIVTEGFVMHVPTNLDLKAVAPLLCAGITTYSPLRHWNIGKGHQVGVIGLGGLGHMAVKLAHGLGAEVTMITTSPNKEQDARCLGASHILLSTDPHQLQQHANHFDFLINTIPHTHDINPYLNLLKANGTMVIVGAIEPLQSGVDCRALIFKRRSVAGSLIGGIKETQELLDFCAKQQILPDVEMIPIQKINEAYERMLKSDVKYRFVIDMKSLHAD